jgi:hypothetical protein
MWFYVTRVQNTVENVVLRMEMRDWAIAVAAMLVIGFVCMRGLSAKTNL